MRLFKGSTEIKSVFKNLMISVSDIFDATATNDKVLVDEIFYNNDSRQVGTMPNNGDIRQNIGLGETFIIPEGYHSGAGRVTSPYIKLQTFYTGSSEPSADLGVAGDLYFLTDSTSSGDSGSTTEPTLISFTIAGVSYQAEEGMTWAEWCSSSYNVDSFYTTTNNVYASDAGYVWYNSSSTGGIRPSDVIISGRDYNHTA